MLRAYFSKAFSGDEKRRRENNKFPFHEFSMDQSYDDVIKCVLRWFTWLTKNISQGNTSGLIESALQGTLHNTSISFVLGTPHLRTNERMKCPCSSNDELHKACSYSMFIESEL